jgi:hypothetical protein
MARTEHVIEPEELMTYLDGELRPDRAITASAHLEHCRECQAIAAGFAGCFTENDGVAGGAFRPDLEDLNAALEQGQQNTAGCG